MGSLGRRNKEKDIRSLRPFLYTATVPVTATDHGTLAGLDDDDHSQYILDTPHFLVLATTAELTYERQLVVGDGLDETDAGAGGTFTIDVDVSELIDAEYGLTESDNNIRINVGVGLDLQASTLILGTPSTNTVSTTNLATSTTHTHAITTSADVSGGSQSILASTTLGDLDLHDLGTNLLDTVTLETDFVNSNLVPTLTDTYDLGDSTKLWRKGWMSELDTIIFAELTVTLTGGWFMITPDSGTVAEDVDNSETQIDFGKAMVPSDFVLFRGNLKVEYMLVGSLVSGTIYNVTRNLDGSGANIWPQGAPFAVLGQSANDDGWIELNAYDTPRISVFDTGSAYNNAVEMVRIGDMVNAYGTSSNHRYGFGIGDFSSDNYLSYNAETADSFILSAGDGGVTLNEDGIILHVGTSDVFEDGTYIDFQEGTNQVAWLGAAYVSSSYVATKLMCYPPTNIDAYMEIRAIASGTGDGRLYFTAQSDADASAFYMYSAGWINFTAGAVFFGYTGGSAWTTGTEDGDVGIENALYVGGGIIAGSFDASTWSPNNGQIWTTGGVRHIDTTSPMIMRHWATGNYSFAEIMLFGISMTAGTETTFDTGVDLTSFGSGARGGYVAHCILTIDDTISNDYSMIFTCSMRYTTSVGRQYGTIISQVNSLYSAVKMDTDGTSIQIKITNTHSLDYAQGSLYIKLVQGYT